jgi:hypothetical protein
MNRLTGRITLLALVSLAALLMVGATAATAHRGGPGMGGKGTSSSALVTAAAKQLNVTRAALVKAIEDAAVSRIDEAVADEDVDADDGDELKEEALDNLNLAMSLSRTKAVATNLGITTAQLNTGFRAARTANITARIDKAVADGDLDADDAAELKAELEDNEQPGYKAAGRGGLGFGFGGGFGHPRGPGGFGR